MKECKACGFKSLDRNRFAIASQAEVLCTLCFSWKAAVRAYAQAKDKIRGLVLQASFDGLSKKAVGA